MDTLRKPFFLAAVVLMLVTVLVEISSLAFLGMDSELPTPGLGIPYLALLDGLVLFTIGLMGMALIVPERIQGRIQGIVTLVVSLLTLLGAISLILLVALPLLILMVSLLMAVPFGTAIYFITYSDFEINAARGTLGTLMLLKLAFAVCLILAHQRFLENKGLVLIVLSSLLANVVVTFLHGLVPVFLVAITDDIGAIVVAVLAAIWALVFLIGSIPAIVKALRVDRAL